MAEREENTAALLEQWRHMASLGIAAIGVLLTGILAFNTLVVGPLVVRVDRLETAIHQAQRDRAEVLVRIEGVERTATGIIETVRRIDRRMEARELREAPGAVMQ